MRSQEPRDLLATRYDPGTLILVSFWAALDIDAAAAIPIAALTGLTGMANDSAGKRACRTTDDGALYRVTRDRSTDRRSAQTADCGTLFGL
jgi:hypothetical protein